MTRAWLATSFHELATALSADSAPPCTQYCTVHRLTNSTGTRGRFNTYNTTAPKVETWQPETKPRA